MKYNFLEEFSDQKIWEIYMSNIIFHVESKRLFEL